MDIAFIDYSIVSVTVNDGKIKSGLQKYVRYLSFVDKT